MTHPGFHGRSAFGAQPALIVVDPKYGDVVSLDEVVAHLEELAGTHAR